MNEFIISDLHLDHANIIKYCHRNFANVTEMNKTICRRWNRVVGEDDLIYYLGDFCHRNPKEWLKRLNGTVIFICGNHDNALKKDKIHPLPTTMLCSKVSTIRTPQALAVGEVRVINDVRT